MGAVSRLALLTPRTSLIGRVDEESRVPGSSLRKAELHSAPGSRLPINSPRTCVLFVDMSFLSFPFFCADDSYRVQQGYKKKSKTHMYKQDQPNCIIAISQILSERGTLGRTGEPLAISVPRGGGSVSGLRGQRARTTCFLERDPVREKRRLNSSAKGKEPKSGSPLGEAAYSGSAVKGSTVVSLLDLDRPSSKHMANNFSLWRQLISRRRSLIPAGALFRLMKDINLWLMAASLRRLKWRGKCYPASGVRIEELTRFSVTRESDMDIFLNAPKSLFKASAPKRSKQEVRDPAGMKFNLLSHPFFHDPAGAIPPAPTGEISLLHESRDAKFHKVLEKLRDDVIEERSKRASIWNNKNNLAQPDFIKFSFDSIVQEVIRILLEIIFEPQFFSSNHGFQNKSQHTCLRQIQRDFKERSWFLVGDLSSSKGCLLARSLLVMGHFIRDRKFLDLVRAATRLRDSSQNQARFSMCQIPLLALLSNISLHELDNFVVRLKRIIGLEREKVAPSSLGGDVQEPSGDLGVATKRKGARFRKHRWNHRWTKSLNAMMIVGPTAPRSRCAMKRVSKVDNSAIYGVSMCPKILVPFLDLAPLDLEPDGTSGQRASDHLHPPKNTNTNFICVFTVGPLRFQSRHTLISTLPPWRQPRWLLFSRHSALLDLERICVRSPLPSSRRNLALISSPERLSRRAVSETFKQSGDLTSIIRRYSPRKRRFLAAHGSIHYVRYSNYFLIGGPKRLACKISRLVTRFLEIRLKLRLNQDAILLKSGKEKVPFLGYLIDFRSVTNWPRICFNDDTQLATMGIKAIWTPLVCFPIATPGRKVEPGRCPDHGHARQLKYKQSRCELISHSQGVPKGLFLSNSLSRPVPSELGLAPSLGREGRERSERDQSPSINFSCSTRTISQVFYPITRAQKPSRSTGLALLPRVSQRETWAVVAMKKKQRVRWMRRIDFFGSFLAARSLINPTKSRGFGAKSALPSGNGVPTISKHSTFICYPDLVRPLGSTASRGLRRDQRRAARSSLDLFLRHFFKRGGEPLLRAGGSTGLAPSLARPKVERFQRRSWPSKIRLLVNMQKVIESLADKGFCDRSGNPKPNFHYFQDSQNKTVARVASLLRGLTNYYQLAESKRRCVSRWSYILTHSIAMMFAAKFKLGTRAKVFALAGRNLIKPLLAKKRKQTHGPVQSKVTK